MGTETIVVNFIGNAEGLKAAVKSVDKELGKLVVRTDAAQRTLGNGLGRGANAAAKGLNNATKATKQLTEAQRLQLRTARQSRANLQNLGFQVQDIAVQLEMGTDAFRVFAQQGSQIAGIFGPSGAFIGAGLAVGAALAPALIAMLGFGDAAKQTEEDIKKLAETMEGLVSETEELTAKTELLNAGLSDTSRNRAITELNNFLEENAAAYDRVVEAEEKLAAITDVNSGEMQRWKNELELAQKALAPIKEQADALRQAIEDNTEAVQDHAIAAADAFGPEARERAIAYMRSVNQEALRAKESVDELTRATMATTGIAGVRAGAGPDQARLQQMGNNLSGQGYDPETGLYGVVGGTEIGPPQETKSRGGGRTKEAEDSVTKLVKEMEELIEVEDKLFEQWKEDNEYLSASIDEGLSSGISGLVDGIAEAGTSWSEFAKDFLRDIAKMILQQSIFNALQFALGGPASGASSESILRTVAGNYANGGVFSNGSVTPFAKGGVVSGPSLFPMTGGTGLMGEAGPEAIMPLTRNSQGELGVAGPAITINNNAGVDVSVTRSDEEIIEIAVNRATKQSSTEFQRSMASGQGRYARSLEQGYSSKRRAS